MGAVNVTAKIDMNAARFAVKRAVGPVMRRRVEQAGKEMVDTANTLMAGDFDLARPYERRRDPGSRRAATALDYAITETADGRLELRFRVLGGEQVFRRIMGMNYGLGGGHMISPNGSWGGLGSLAVRSRPSKAGRGSGEGKLAWEPSEEFSGVVTGSVWWYPTSRASEGTGFLEDAAAVAAASLGGTFT